jgi:small redox-active disulfide protein 2
MRIEVLGTGCVRCNTTEAIVREAVSVVGIEAEVVKVSDRKEIGRSGVTVTPAVKVDGKLKSVGKVPTVEEVIEWIHGGGQ